MIRDHVDTVLPELQAQAESLMITRCRVRRPTSVTADPETGADVIAYADEPIYQGVAPGCKIQDGDLQVVVAEMPGASVEVLRIRVHVPVSSGPFQIGDIIESFADSDTDYTTPLRTFRVSGIHQKSWQTSQRLPVEEIT